MAFDCGRVVDNKWRNLCCASPNCTEASVGDGQSRGQLRHTSAARESARRYMITYHDAHIAGQLTAT
eukprot:1434586-Pleurochrysis_carterae.AAC.1